MFKLCWHQWDAWREGYFNDRTWNREKTLERECVKCHTIQVRKLAPLKNRIQMALNTKELLKLKREYGLHYFNKELVAVISQREKGKKDIDLYLQDRLKRIKEMKAGGMSYRQIGIILGISKQRVYQILLKSYPQEST